MNLGDLLDGVGTVVGLGVIALCAKELIYNKYIPWTKKIEKEYDKHPEMDGYIFSDENKEKK
jgi:hypothetical protein